ncbi:MAG: dockerin type I domain-containing protein, partial [Paludibacter sp.]
HINDSTLTEAVMINPTLITDTLYTDFAVTPNKKYYYYYKVMRTNMSETDPSKVVSAIPFTASKGDANGDLNVNVLDITTIVAYLLNNNPQPFIREAADLNNDNNINVLDIVGVVNKILNVPQNAPSIAMTKQVELFMQNDTLFANSNVPVGGIQLDIKGISSVEDIQILKALDGFESGNSLRSDSLRLIFYSMSGKNIPAGERIPLLKLKTGSTIVNAIFGETNGSPIKVNYILTRIGNISNNMNQTVAELGQNFPNPLNFQTTIPMRIYEPVEEAVLRIVNMMGQEVKVISMKYPTIGEHLLQWDAGTNKGLFVYTLEIKSGNQRQICPIKKMIVQ